jgi:hypothetical protein
LGCAGKIRCEKPLSQICVGGFLFGNFRLARRFMQTMAYRVVRSLDCRAARAFRGPAIRKNLLISWASARYQDRPYNSV